MSDTNSGNCKHGVPRSWHCQRCAENFGKSRAIAEDLVDDVLHVIEPGEIESVTKSIQDSLDKYFDDGTIQWRPK